METTAGSVTSTKQFVWAKDTKRPFQPCEERDATGTLTKKFFDRGQQNTATKYFYTKDYIGSVREMTDNSGVLQAQYAFDPYGQVTKISEAIPSDFGFTGYYEHLRSNLRLSIYRKYSATLARWLSRDPIGERSHDLGALPDFILDTNEIPPVTVDPRPYATAKLQLANLRNERSDTNLYTYAENRPISVTDPSGLFGCQTCYAFGPVCATYCMCLPEPQKSACVAGCTAAFIWCLYKCDWMDDLPGRTSCPPAPPRGGVH